MGSLCKSHNCIVEVCSGWFREGGEGMTMTKLIISLSFHNFGNNNWKRSMFCRYLRKFVTYRLLIKHKKVIWEGKFAPKPKSISFNSFCGSHKTVGNKIGSLLFTESPNKSLFNYWLINHHEHQPTIITAVQIFIRGQASSQGRNIRVNSPRRD